MCAGRGGQDWSGECRCDSTPGILQEQQAVRVADEQGKGADSEGKAGALHQQQLTFPEVALHLFDCREHRTLERGTYPDMWEAISFASLRNLVWMAQVSISLAALQRFLSHEPGPAVISGFDDHH